MLVAISLRAIVSNHFDSRALLKFEKSAAAPGGRGGRARTRSGDGEGWGRDRGGVAPFVRRLLFSARPRWRRRLGDWHRARPIHSGPPATAASRSGSWSPTRAGSDPPDCRG